MLPGMTPWEVLVERDSKEVQRRIRALPWEDRVPRVLLPREEQARE